MYPIALVGALIVVLSGAMILRPERWSGFMMTFSEMKYARLLEAASGLLFGAVLMLFAEETRDPILVGPIGLVFAIYGVALLLTPSSVLQAFVRWWARKKLFVPAALGAVVIGVYLVYVALASA
jgi:hypothetical protein